MEAERSPQQTHNILLSKYLNTKQAKFVAIARPEQGRSTWTGQIEHKYLTRVAIGGQNFVRIIHLYEHGHWHEEARGRLYEDITGVFFWDRVLLVQTKHKIVGLIEQDSVLKNLFLISLQFLPLTHLSASSTVVDQTGNYVAALICDYLILIVSEAAVQKHRSRPYYRAQSEVVSEESTWNRPDRPSISDIIKIKLSDLGLMRVSGLHFCNDRLYFIGVKIDGTGLFSIAMDEFFVENSRMPLCALLSKVDTDVITMIPYRQSQDVEFFSVKNTAILSVSRQKVETLIEFQSEPKYHSKFTSLPVPFCLQVDSKLVVYDRVENQLVATPLEPKNTEIMDYRSKVLVYGTKSAIFCQIDGGAEIQLHSSFGSIIDFTLGRTYVVCENYEANLSRIQSIRRSIKVDSRPFVIHSRKNFLEALTDVKSLESISRGSYLCVHRTNGLADLYADRGKDYQLVLEGLLWAANTSSGAFLIKAGNQVALMNAENINASSFTLQPNLKRDRLWLLEDKYLGVLGGNELTIFNMDTGSTIATLTLEPQLIYVQLSLHWISFRAQAGPLLQVLAVSHKKLTLYECCPVTNGLWAQVQVTTGIEEGPALLLHSPSELNKNRLRSHTCPEYVLSECLARPNLKIVKAFLYHTDTLLLITNSQELIQYQRCSSSCFPSGYVFKRLPLPLHVAKGFRYQAETALIPRGEDFLQCCNYMLIRGNYLEYEGTYRSVFKMEQALWVLQGDGKIRMLDMKGELRENFIVHTLETSLKADIQGIQSTPDYTLVYSRRSFEVLTKESSWRMPQEAQDTKISIITMKAFENYMAMSYYEYYEDEQLGDKYQSIKFKFRVYSATSKSKIIEKEKNTPEPIQHIRFVPPNRLLLVTSTTVFINTIRNDKTLELTKTKNFSRRLMLSSFSYMPEQVPNKPGYMLFGGSQGGISFFVGKWMEADQLWERWFEPMRAGIRDLQLFHFGMELKALVADKDDNLIVLSLKPDHAEKICDVQVGSAVTRLRARTSNDNQVYCSFENGCIGLVVPLLLDDPEISFLDLQSTMTKLIPLLGGFNLLESRILCQEKRTYNLTATGNVLDHDLFEDFFALSDSLKNLILDHAEMSLETLKASLIC